MFAALEKTENESLKTVCVSFCMLHLYVFECVGDCDCVCALSTAGHVWLIPFRPGKQVTKQGNRDLVSGWMRL